MRRLIATRKPITVRIFLVSILIALITGLALLYLSAKQLKNELYNEKKADLQTTMISLQETLQYLAKKKDQQQIQRTIALMGADLDVNQVFLLDNDGVVISATRIDAIEKNVADLMAEEALSKIQLHVKRMKKSLRNSLWLSADNTSLYGLAPIKLGFLSSESVRSDNIGSLLIHYNLAWVEKKNSDLSKSVLLPMLLVLLFTGIFIAIYFNSTISRRIKALNNTALAFASGDYHERVQVIGNDEIADLGDVFNLMAHKVQTLLSRTQESEQRLKEAQRIAKVGSWHLNLESNQVTWSEELYRMYGYDPQLPAPQYTDHATLFTSSSWELLNSSLKDLKENGSACELELETVNSNGSNGWIWVKAERLSNKCGEIAGLQAVVMDITERKDADKKQKLSAQIFDNSLESIIITNASKEIIDVNPAFTDITGFLREEVIGKNPKILSSGRQTPEFYQSMWQEIREHGYWQGELWNRHRNGELYAEFLTIIVLNNELGEITNYVGFSNDITSNKKQQEQLNLMAYYDTLTGLPNRSLFADRFSQAIAHSKRIDHRLAVCFLDLDNFKQVNDNYGHGVGDQLLVDVAERLKATIREEDTVSRQGGDEFALLLNDIESLSQCEASLDRIISALSEPYVIDGIVHEVTTSIGVTLYPDDHADIDTLIRHADNSMYQAKLSGRNRYHFFDSKHDEQLIQKHQKLSEIEHALKNNQLNLYYQPKVNMVTGEVYGAEALMRWIHPEKGVIPPLDFLPLLDGTDLELQMGDWVIDQALEQLDHWLAKGIKLEVSVNIASHHLQSDAFLENLEDALAGHPEVEPCYLQLEILESSTLSDLNKISHIIEHCQSGLGVTIALDDFGTGYSSLTHLRNLSANTIKIDQSFVRDMLDDPNDYSIINGVIGLTESFGCEVIAEGVEETEQGLMLLVIGCNKAQGYGIAKPMPANELEQWLKIYTPNKKWLECANTPRTTKENRLLLFRLISERWLAFFVENIQSEPNVVKEWPNMRGQQDPSGQWLKRERNGVLFTEEEIAYLENIHEDILTIAELILDKYQEGQLETARVALPKLQAASKLLGLANMNRLV